MGEILGRGDRLGDVVRDGSLFGLQSGKGGYNSAS
jgi:hypothetical protein